MGRSKLPHSGRPPAAGVARTKFFKVRLTPMERQAIRHLERELAEMIRKVAREHMTPDDLPRAS